MQASKEDRSLGELFGDLTREISTLVRQEVNLAATELGDKATRVGKDIGYLAIGGAVAYAGFLALLAAVVIGLAGFMPWWLSALVVGAVVAGIGYFLIQRGIGELKHIDLAPRQTIGTLKEDVQWAKQQAK
jgi:xanthine/uracil permease